MAHHEHYHGHHDQVHSHDDHSHTHNHDNLSGPLKWLRELIPFLHGHSHQEAALDTAMETSERGLWALKVSLLGLGITALFQLVIVFISGSVALLADTIHNFSDALTAIPLGIAFILGRRMATRRYTYGFGRAEDLAGLVIVLMIFLSALVAGYESIIKIIHPEPMRHVWWVMAASLIGFLGNELVALFRIRVGKEIGSAALIADGQHARVDGLTSLAVLFGVVGTMLGFPLADPIIGLLITVAILFIVKDAAISMWHRMMDAVDPAIITRFEQAAAATTGVQHVQQVRARWIGHSLIAEVQVTVDEDLPLRKTHEVVERVRHNLSHTHPRLTNTIVSTQPCGHGSRS